LRQEFHFWPENEEDPRTVKQLDDKRAMKEASRIRG